MKNNIDSTLLVFASIAALVATGCQRTNESETPAPPAATNAAPGTPAPVPPEAKPGTNAAIPAPVTPPPPIPAMPPDTNSAPATNSAPPTGRLLLKNPVYAETTAAPVWDTRLCSDDTATPAGKSNPSDTTEDYAGKFGLGIIIGEPTGLSAKLWLNDRMAVDAAAGWSLHDDSDFYLHSDFLYHKFDLIPVSSGRMPFYFGAGGFVRFRDEDRDNQAGIRVPVGVSYMFEKTPVDIFAEFAPGIDLTPSTRCDFTGGIGMRFWF